ncbi:hypothetical protein FRC07_002692 [Ceratobasidium sp. 392]|nr:hypothetical protein FRC07_002692 [Ceratobasidium sp. 392]
MSSRPSIDQLDARSGPVPHFDRHLSVLKNGYLNFFMERVRIEGTYIEELKALYKRIKQQDASFDLGMEYSQARSAWREVRDSLDRGAFYQLAVNVSNSVTEVQSRTAFCSAINTDVIRPLRDLRDTQDRTRQRIYEDMKESVAVYTECADNQLPRAQKQYKRKCQEAEESRLAPTIPMPPNPQQIQPSATPTPLFSPTQEMFSPPPSYTNLSSEATMNANPGGNNKNSPPTPNASATGLVSTTSRSEDPSRARSPPPVLGPVTGPRGAVQDLAQHGKKGLNQLKSFLDSKRDGGGSLREGSEKGNIALRNVRAKREAEEADKEYRQVVYKLETLRRWRGNVVRAGFTSLETFMVDLSQELTRALQRYTDTLVATSTTNAQLAHQSQSIIAQINPEPPLVFGERETEGSSPASSTFFNTPAHPEKQDSGATVKPDNAAEKDATEEELPGYHPSGSNVSLGPEKGEKSGSVSGHSAKPSISEAQGVVYSDKVAEKQKESNSVRDAPLPPEPAGEAPMKIEYGSSHTLVRHPTVTGDTDFSPRLPDIDFAPRLPPRPGKSIHPASRAAALNPSNPEADIQPPPLPPRSGSVSEPLSEPPSLPPRKLGSGAPSLDVRLPSPLPEMTFPRTPPSPLRTPAEGETPTPSTPIKSVPSITTTPIKTTMAGNSPMRSVDSPVTPLRPAMERSETDSPGTAEFTTPVSSPMTTRTTPSRTATSDELKDLSPRKSGETKRI